MKFSRQVPMVNTKQSLKTLLGIVCTNNGSSPTELMMSVQLQNSLNKILGFYRRLTMRLIGLVLSSE